MNESTPTILIADDDEDLEIVVKLHRHMLATLRAILDGHPQSRIEELMPWRFPTPSSRAA